MKLMPVTVRSNRLFRAARLGVAFAVVCWLSPALGAGPTPVSVHGQLTIVGNRFVDQGGKPVTLHGMSTYNWAQQGTQYYNRTAITRIINEWKVSVIRVVLNPPNVASQTRLVDTVVQTCIDNGVYVIVNWHVIGGANATDCANWMAGFAQRYGSKPNIMYEPWNEPTTDSWATIKTYMTTVIAAIRTHDPDGIVICGNPSWCQRPDYAATDPVPGDNIAYTLHFYAVTHRLSSFRTRLKTTLDAGRAIFCTEYGTCEATGNGAIDTAETRRWYGFLDSNGIGSANWSISALSETSAAFNPGASPTNWTDGDLKPSGRFVRSYLQSKHEATTGMIMQGGQGLRQDASVEDEGQSLVSVGASAPLFILNGARAVVSVAGLTPTRGRYVLALTHAGRRNILTVR